MVKTAIILAAGLGSRLKERTIDKPKGFVEVGGIPIVERSVQRLIDNGIERIVIGTGYLAEFYERLATRYPQILCIPNDRYRDSGSMRTLYGLREAVDENFLLLESDLLYDPLCLGNLIADPREDIVLASGTTHSEDEVYIETDEYGMLRAVSKRPEELRSIDAELVGISKISKETYRMMCEAAEREMRDQPKWDYEYALVAVSAHKPIPVKKIEKLAWCEIDTEEHLERAAAEIYPRIAGESGKGPFSIQRNVLLNPGPATTTDTVKQAQVVPDICPREREFGDLMEWIAEQLTLFVAPKKDYETVLFGGSGTAAVESVISSVVGDGKLLIISNGAYGERMAEIAEVYRVDHEVLASSPVLPVSPDAIEAAIRQSEGKITHAAVVHNETTSGVLNDIEAIAEICVRYNVQLIVDAMSSYGAIPIDMAAHDISYVVASSNKNLQGMAGIGFVVANRERLTKLRTHTPKSYYLDLYKQYEYLKRTHQLRFTPPVQTLYALEQAIVETQIEGIEQRYRRYSESWAVLIEGIERLGLECLVPTEYHSRIITAIKEPDLPGYDFERMHDFLYERGITIYPGKIGKIASFRIANIGAIDKTDIERFLQVLSEYFTSLK
ncbi:2-aminoethylphosphonate--pyruvate transaminase [Saccharibacillus sp. O23]|uniref:2-aminoethylphosphonate aminotransferase n=1 Tax=Saccharibacillus sp. O23 TaxID=2009338 RepID=UPI000B4DF41A|nr:2-aminoethylphosphonate--pyruvate transaminase [Saccharibacillus sp. O23]OWR27581.1 2-aminoethylphosphonate--pyruvate transaminase [Saccharibacillus sp. O23]